jgi:hypothetical protein
MRRKALWIGVAAVVAGYLGWNALHPVSSPSEVAPLVASPIPPTTTVPAATETPNVPPVTPTPTSAAAPTLLLNAGRVTRGQVVVGSGFGFASKEKIRLTKVNPSGPPTAIATTKADEHGSFSGLLIRVADTWPNGPQKFEVEGLTSHRRASASFDLEGSPPGAKPTTYSGKPMSLVSFSGGGFSAHEEVDVYFDTLASPVLGHFTANQIGVVHVDKVAVPISSPGQHAFLLVGRNSRAPVRVPFSVLSFTPWISLSSYTPQPEQPVGVFGHDFARGERVAIFLDSAQGRPVSFATVDANGAFKVDPAVVIPYDRRGKVNIIAVGTASQATATATLTVRPYTPIFALSRYAGPPGTAISLTGQGFAKNETVHVRMGDAQHPITVVVHTDSNGKLAATNAIQVPKNMSSGKVPIIAEGAHSQAPASVTFAVIPLSPWFGPVPAAGPAGTRVSFDGGGFAPDEQLEISMKTTVGTTLAATLTTDGSGAMHHAGSLMIPTSMSGQVTLEATGIQSGARATTTFTVVPGPPPRPKRT